MAQRKYLKLQDVINFAEEYFDKTKKGINFSLLQRKFGIIKSKSQRILKRSRANHLLFTPKHSIPQMYYPESRHFDVIEHLKKENVPLNTTGTTNSKSPLSDCIQHQKDNEFLAALKKIYLIPLGMHKIEVQTTVGKECYNLIQSESWEGNRAKGLTEPVEDKQVSYIYYKNGNIVIKIACSNNPFRIENEDDIAILFSFFGQIRDRIEYQISDPHGRMVPPITHWILKQCDFNKDIPIPNIAQVTLPDIQLRSAFHVFRLYVKNLDGKAYYRCEDSRVVNQPLVPFLNFHINPISELFKMSKDIEEIKNKIKTLN